MLALSPHREAKTRRTTARRAEQRRGRRRCPGVAARALGLSASLAPGVTRTGAALLGDRAAIAALEQGEDRDLALYSDGIPGCDPRTRKLIETQLLPAQQHTHDLCRTLKSYTETPS
jgi:hypothetical protein